jgi:hypothetical protein
VNFCNACGIEQLALNPTYRHRQTALGVILVGCGRWWIIDGKSLELFGHRGGCGTPYV